MTRYPKLLLWVFVIIPLIGFLGSRLREPGPVNMPTTTSTISSPAGGRGHAAPGATTSSPSPRAAIAKPKAVASISLPELNDQIKAKPTHVVSLTFVNGSNKVLVHEDNGTDAAVIVSDGYGKHDLNELASANGVPVTVMEPPAPDPIGQFLANNGFALIFFGGFLLLMFMGQRNAAKQMKGVKGMGSSRAKDADALKDKIKKASFSDVAGCDEAVHELRRVVKGIVGAEIYTLFHAELPKGVLLIGPPGTGKTHLARAVAGETGGSFDITSGSDFVEMLVGVGASRVRDMFDRARKKVAETKKPHIIFIDEIDAIGGKRGGGTAAGSNSEREQTLNQLLVEMDGMVGNEGILIIAATNRVDMLDDALLRQGRFDCHVSVDLPDKAGREAIFKIHLADIMAEGIKLAEDVTLPALAHRTYSYSGAEIKGVCNRAKILAAERHAPEINALKGQGKSMAEIVKLIKLELTLAEFDEAVDFVRYGNSANSKQKRMRDEDKKNTAVHEGGHAIVAAALPACDPVVKVTIMRRSRALGYVQYLPENDRVSFTFDQAIARIVGMMAGRAAQEVILGTCDTGASNDFQQATDMARKMVVSWGMSPLGHISVGDRQDMMGTAGGPNSIGPDLANEIDREWRKITRACYKAAKAIVKADRARIDALVERLLETETVLADEFKAIMEEHKSNVDVEALQLPKAAAEEE